MLEARNLSIRFGGLKAVEDVSLTVRRGAIVALIGPNGAGKTTLFNLVSGFLKPLTGAVALEGRDITGLAPHEVCRLGMTRTFRSCSRSARRRCARTSRWARTCTTAVARPHSHGPRRSHARWA